ncbi:MAG: sugar phosphate nucleotidyltransferase, partial [Candidatus Margulisiibacteriota bacterium]
EKPIIEIIMEKYEEFGIKEFHISINHKARMIKSYFEEMGDNWKIHFVEEKKPLGTIGSLRLVKRIRTDNLFVTNCDIIINGDYEEMLAYHKKNNNDITLIASYRNFVIPYGVCDIENGGLLKKIREKPQYDLLVSTGMYIIKKKTIGLIPGNKRFDANEFISKVIALGGKIGVFPVDEKSWIDVGQWNEYHKSAEKLGMG